MQVILNKNFKKKYIKLDRKIQQKFRTRRDLFFSDPFHPLLNNHALTGDRKGEWSINITGDWRVVYIWKNAYTAIFLDIDTHSNLYG